MHAKNNQGRLLVKLALALALMGAAGFWALQQSRDTVPVKPVNRDMAVDAVSGSVMVHAYGDFRELRSEAAGKVAVANLKPGSPFRKGDVLVQLDTTELERQAAEAKRDYEWRKERSKTLRDSNPEKKVAEEQLATARRMLALGNTSEEQVKALERALDAIVTRLKLADIDEQKAEEDYRVRQEEFDLQRQKMRVTAPFDGTIHNDGEMTWVGALINAGQPVAKVFARERIVAAKISEESFGKVKVGQPARVRLLTYGSESFQATVAELLPSADDQQRFTVHLKVQADPDQLRPLSTGEVTITVDQEPDQMMILRRSVFDSNKVFVVKNGRVERREIEIGHIALNVVQVIKGLEVGDHVIVDRLDELRAGQRVNIEVVP